jgi:hypothetical protein
MNVVLWSSVVLIGRFATPDIVGETVLGWSLGGCWLDPRCVARLDDSKEPSQAVYLWVCRAASGIRTRTYALRVGFRVRVTGLDHHFSA